MENQEVSKHYSETTRDGYPRRSVIVLVTFLPGNTPSSGREYRAAFVREKLLRDGIRRQDDPHKLNMEVVAKLFSASEVFCSRNEAIEAAQPLTDEANAGIKVYHVNDVWQKSLLLS